MAFIETIHKEIGAETMGINCLGIEYDSGYRTVSPPPRSVVFARIITSSQEGLCESLGTSEYSQFLVQLYHCVCRHFSKQLAIFTYWKRKIG